MAVNQTGKGNKMRKLKFSLLILLGSILGCFQRADAGYTFFSGAPGGFVPNTATAAFLAAIGGAPDEFLSFNTDKLGNPVTTGGLQPGTIWSNNVVFSSAVSGSFGGVNSSDVRLANANSGSSEIGPAGTGYNGILKIDFLAAGKIATAVGLGTVDGGSPSGISFIRIYDASGTLVATPTPPATVFGFFGVVATAGSTIGRIELDDNFYAIQDAQYKVGGGGGTSCLPHRIHGHISTVPPTHSGTSHEHHGTHGHRVTSGCLSHAPSHSSGGSNSGGAPDKTAPGGLASQAGLFSASEVAEAPTFVAGRNEDGSINGSVAVLSLPGTTVRAARRGSVVQLFGSAAGLYLGDDERAAEEFTPPASGLPLYYTTRAPEVQIGGMAAKVLFSGLAPGLNGVWQINVLVPDETPVGTVPVSISYDGTALRAIDIVIE